MKTTNKLLWAMMLGFVIVSMAACQEQARAIASKDPSIVKNKATKPPDDPIVAEPKVEVFDSAQSAMKKVLAKTNPTVIGFGEFHQTNDTTEIESAIKRFTDSLIPLLVSRTSNLVIETWVNAGNCGKKEDKVLKDVKKTTDRPETTETEIVKLMNKARELGVAPHILEIGCDDYNKLLENDGQVDYWELLELITLGLQDKTKALVTGAANGKKKTVVIYGGAIHNDLNPYDELKDYSYAKALKDASADRYVEVDLYVPEFVENNEPLKQESWFPLFRRMASPARVLLIERAKNSYIIVFKRGVKASRSPD